MQISGGFRIAATPQRVLLIVYDAQLHTESLGNCGKYRRDEPIAATADGDILIAMTNPAREDALCVGSLAEPAFIIDKREAFDVTDMIGMHSKPGC